MPSNDVRRYENGRLLEPDVFRRVRQTSKGAFKIKEGTLHRQKARYWRGGEWWLTTMYEGREFNVPEIFFDPIPRADDDDGEE
jgi:hypothetical protein